jgi:lysophospholipase L1-like esterase
MLTSTAQFVNPDEYDAASTDTFSNSNDQQYQTDYSGGYDYDQQDQQDHQAQDDLATVAKYPDMGGTSTVTQVHDSSLPDSKVTVVACLGDSITQGYRSSSGNTYPEALQTLLGNSFEVYNLGVGGTTVGESDEDGTWSSDLMYSKTSEFNEALAISPDIVVIMLGTNDAKTAPPRHKWAEKEAGFIKEFNNIIDAVQRLPSHPVVMIALPPPLYVDGNFAMDGSVINRALPSLLRSIQQSNDLPPLIDTFGALGGTGLSREDLMTMVDPTDGYTADGCHPNDNGYAQVAQTVFDAIEDAVERASALNFDVSDDLFSHRGGTSTAAVKGGSGKGKGKAGDTESGSNMLFFVVIGVVCLAGVGYMLFLRGKTKTTTSRRTPGATAANPQAQRATNRDKQKQPRRQPHNSDNVSVM